VGSTIVATSREILRIDGESVYRVPPLDVPALGQAAPDCIMQYSAVELFIARTKALNAGFSPHADDLASIATAAMPGRACQESVGVVGFINESAFGCAG
jgi:predicted ATPase